MDRLQKYFQCGYNKIATILSREEKYKEALIFYNKSLNTGNGGIDYVVYYNIGSDCMRQKKYSKAIGYFTKAIKLKPTFSYPWYKRGVAYMNKLDFWNAKNDIYEAIKLGMLDDDVLNNLHLAEKYSNIHDDVIKEFFIEKY